MIQKRLTLLGGGLILGLSLFYCAVCTPISVWTNTDVLIKETMFPTIWDLFQTLISFAIYWITITFLILFCHHFDAKGNMPFFGCYGLATLIRYFGSLMIGSLMTKEISDGEIFLENLIYCGLDILLDFVQIAIIVLLIYWLLLRKSTAKSRGILFEDLDWFHSPNRLNVTVLATVAIPSLIRLFSRIIYDVNFGKVKNTIDLLWMIFFYFADVISIVCGYFAVVFLIRKLQIPTKKEEDPLSNLSSK